MKFIAKAYNSLYEKSYFHLFSFLRERRAIEKTPIQLSSSSRVLAFTCAGIGDTLTDSVVFKALAETYPGIHLGAVVHTRRRALLAHNPYVSEIFDFQKGWPAFMGLQQQLKEAGAWDAILHLRGNDPEPRCHSFLLNPAVTVSTPNMTRYGFLCGHTVEQPDWDETHGVLQTLRLAHYVGAKCDEPGLVYEVKPAETAQMEAKLQKFKVGPRPRIVLQIGGGRRASWRDWPVGHYAELVSRLSKNLPAEIIVLGGKDNLFRARDLADRAKRFGGGYHDLVGKMSLEESAALLKSARVVVSTDTGMMHLSYAVGTRVVALIHCNNPSHRVGPYGYGDRHRVLQLPRPAGYRHPADASMADISTGSVEVAVQDLWKISGDELA